MAIILEALMFLLGNIGKILSLVGLVSVGAWTVHRIDNSTSTGSGGSSGGTSTPPHTILGTVNFVAWAAIAVAGFAVVRQYLRDRQP